MKRIAQLSLFTLLLVGQGLALAQDRGPDRGPDRGADRRSGPREARGGMVFDHRFSHDRYYPAPGYLAPALPRNSLSVYFGPDRFFFDAGIWYRPYGAGWRVVVPPVGIVIPILPSAYVTLMIGGLAYYYANGVYYTNYSAGPGYVVVTPPPNAETASVVASPASAPVPAPAPARPDPIIYPRNGQSAQQLETDRQECNRWATTQPSAMNDSSVFNRAVEACMDGRGYTMK